MFLHFKKKKKLKTKRFKKRKEKKNKPFSFIYIKLQITKKRYKILKYKAIAVSKTEAHHSCHIYKNKINNYLTKYNVMNLICVCEPTTK